MIYPGDTQALDFVLPFRKDYIYKAVVSFSQMGEEVLSVDASSINTITDSTCSAVVNLTQAQSLQLKSNFDVTIQVNVITYAGERLPSEPIVEHVGCQIYYKTIETNEVNE